MEAGLLVAFFIGGMIGFMLGMIMDFNWKAMFEYLLRREEMRMKYSMDLLKQDSEV